MIVAHLTNSLANNIATETALPENDLKTKCTPRYKPSVDRDTQLTRLQDVEAKDGHNIKHD